MWLWYMYMYDHLTRPFAQVVPVTRNANRIPKPTAPDYAIYYKYMQDRWRFLYILHT